MTIDKRMLARMSDELFGDLAFAVVNEATQRCLLVVHDGQWQLAVDAVTPDHDVDGPMIRLWLER